jgi:phosphoribosylformylglycinamidine synthase
MTVWRVEIKHKKGVFDPLADGVRKTASELGLKGLENVELILVYRLQGDLNKRDIDKIAAELLVNPVVQEYKAVQGGGGYKVQEGKTVRVVEIAYNPGVMDPVENSTLKGIRDLGFEQAIAVRTAKRYVLHGNLSSRDLDVVTNKILANKLIQHVVTENEKSAPIAVSMGEKKFQLVHVDLIGSDDKELMRISSQGQLFLNLDEMKAIQKHFMVLGRNPTDCELETIAQTWSEHCFHKTFRGNISYTWTENGKVRRKKIKNLLKSTIMKATLELNKPWCVSVFHDNAGVIDFDGEDCVCFKVETHNHPSALEPFGGANTGIGGVIRDILGTGLGAKPICNTDVFCFAPPDTDFTALPPGTLHPKRVMKGVVSGVRDYGNKMGIPTVNGSISFDEHFVGNPLVYCGTVGIMPKGMVEKKVNKGDKVVVVGGRTGRDGIHGATFSSGELTTESEVVSSGAVQIGDPIQEKKVLDSLLKARDKGLFNAVTDCGAGGLSSAVGEMGKDLGATVDLGLVPLKYEGLSYEEIWISESQERMVLAVAPEKVVELLDVFAAENVEATVIGEFTGSGWLELWFNGNKVCDIDMNFLHEGNPRITKEAVWALPKIKEPRIPKNVDLNEKIHEVISHYNVCSKEWVIRQYDHEVQGGSVIKPLSGINCDGPSDASVIIPKYDSCRGIAISNGINFRYGKIDPYWMSMSCIDEAIRQIVAVGGNIEKIAILDNFCWGNPDKPDRLGGLVRASEGCYAAAKGFGVPFISGKDSLYNEYAEGKKSIAIPGTILISAIGIIEDVRRTVTMDFKKAGDFIYIVGETDDELGGSIYYDTFAAAGSNVPKLSCGRAATMYKKIYAASQKGLIAAMHDCSEGGIGVALAEMAFSGGFGITARLSKVPYRGESGRNDAILFSESNSRLIVEVAAENQKSFEKTLAGVKKAVIGTVEATPEFIIYGKDEKPCVNTYIQDLKQSWQQPLRW